MKRFEGYLESEMKVSNRGRHLPKDINILSQALPENT